jgi:hypothetical protein
LILDTGGVLALVRGDQHARARQRAAANDGAEVVVPPAVVTQTIRGGSRDAPINRLLKTVQVPAVTLSLAREAGILLASSGLSDAADAQIMAEAIRRGPCIVLTSDPTDMALLAEGRSDIDVAGI